MNQHPLAADAIDTLTAMRAAAIDRALRAERRLDERDTLPRGPLPVMAKLSEHQTTAAHLELAIVALGGEA